MLGAIVLDVLKRWPSIEPASVEPLGAGLINETFAVDAGSERYVLQRVHKVFSPEIHRNIVAVTEHLARAGITTPRLVPTDDGAHYVIDDGEVWRLQTRIDGETFNAVGSPAQAYSAAALLGRFHGALADLEHRFVGLRAGVHDTAAHRQHLIEAVDAHTEHRLHGSVAALAEDIERAAAKLPALPDAPDRVVHGDPKFNNVIFAHGPASKPEARALIDLDTVGPLRIGLELGDAWRSWCNARGEDETQAHFDLEVFEAAVLGWSSAAAYELGPGERASLLLGVEWVTLELAARFAADALLESYFGWDAARFSGRGEHNLVRAKGQWSLHNLVVDTRSEREEILTRAGLT